MPLKTHNLGELSRPISFPVFQFAPLVFSNNRSSSIRPTDLDTMSVDSSSDSPLAVVSDLSLGSDREDVDDFSYDSNDMDSEDNAIPRKHPLLPRKFSVKLCADCKQLFEHKGLSWEPYEPDDEFQEPYHRVQPETLPRPRLRPTDFYGGRYWTDGDTRSCKLCSLLGSQVEWDALRPESFRSEDTKLLDIAEVEDFRWGVRLYENGFIELWLAYKFQDPEKRWSMSHLVTLVPVTEVGWCAKSPSLSECDLVPVSL